jgi:imidazolonepropionase-like amidohydrolase
MIAIANATILTGTGKKIPDGILLIDKNKIRALGKDLKIPKGCRVMHARKKFVLPGLIDAHTHLGVSEVGIRAEGYDYNETTDAANPHLRAMDGLNPMEKGFVYARCGGVTTAAVAPGSANPLGGAVTVIKTSGSVVDEMIIKELAGIKAAFGENPKFVGRDLRRAPVTRMSTAAFLRTALVKARNYVKNRDWAVRKKDKPPDRDLFNESLVPVLERRIPLRVHAHRADDIATAVRIAEEFNIRIVLEHGTEAYLIADWIKDKGVPIIAGPALGTPTKIETQALSFKALKVYQEKGIRFAITTDHPFNGIQYLLLCAIMGVREGLTESDALRAITISPARILGLEKRVGSLEPGKDADLVVMSGDPFDARSKVEKTFINGQVVFDLERDGTPF